MRVDVRFRGLDVSAWLREHTFRQAEACLGRFERELNCVRVRIADVNGPKGGLDKACRVTVHGPRCGSFTVDELSTDPYVAVALAFERLSHSLNRQFARARVRKTTPLLAVRAS
ncbi:MAG: HPF/RaiA family ribosome-associated protein [Myxococcales bacterium]|nr:HPF/RaiA family ribosome-associated protein [Myxococcales bacterium]